MRRLGEDLGQGVAAVGHEDGTAWVDVHFGNQLGESVRGSITPDQARDLADRLRMAATRAEAFARDLKRYPVLAGDQPPAATERRRHAPVADCFCCQGSPDCTCGCHSPATKDRG